MSSVGAARSVAVPASNARAEASRRNGAKSRGPKTAAGKARSAMNALKHGLRAEKYVTLVDEEWDDFVKLEAALTLELAPAGPLQSLLARRIARAAWRLIRADRLETEVFAERHFPGGGPGLALIRDGNGTRTIETLLRYRGAAMAEFQRCLRMLKALQAEQPAVPVEQAVGVTRVARSSKPGTPALVSHCEEPNKPEPRSIDESGMPDQPKPGRALHGSVVPWQPSEPEAVRGRSATAVRAGRTNPGRDPGRQRRTG
jgi:hypothetical protein